MHLWCIKEQNSICLIIAAVWLLSMETFLNLWESYALFKKKKSAGSFSQLQNNVNWKNIPENTGGENPSSLAYPYLESRCREDRGRGNLSLKRKKHICPSFSFSDGMEQTRRGTKPHFHWNLWERKEARDAIGSERENPHKKGTQKERSQISWEHNAYYQLKIESPSVPFVLEHTLWQETITNTKKD